jgi:hypothetical protein
MAAFAVAQEFKSRLAQSIAQLLDEIRHAAAAGISMRSRPIATISTIMSCFSHDGSFNSIRSWTIPGKITRNSSRLDAQALSPKGRSIPSTTPSLQDRTLHARRSAFPPLGTSFDVELIFTTPAGATPLGRRHGSQVWPIDVVSRSSLPRRRISPVPPYHEKDNFGRSSGAGEVHSRLGAIRCSAAG